MFFEAVQVTNKECKVSELIDFTRRNNLGLSSLKEGAQPETVRKELSVLRKALTLAHARKLMRADPRLCFPEFRAHSKTRDRYLTETEFGSLLSALSPSRQLWVAIAVYTGCRFSELEALRWEEHIALESRWIQVPGTKTAKAWRKVPIAEPLAEVLSTHWQPMGPVVAPWCNVREIWRSPAKLPEFGA